MKRLLILFCLIFATGFSFAQDEMKIEGNCKGEDHGNDISLTYFSAFDGCQNKSEAALNIQTNQTSKLKGTRVISNGLDQYSFTTRANGKAKTIYWLIFTDSTGNDTGIFKYKDASGVLRSVQLQCEIFDYEYSECGKR